MSNVNPYFYLPQTERDIQLPKWQNDVSLDLGNCQLEADGRNIWDVKLKKGFL